MKRLSPRFALLLVVPVFVVLSAVAGLAAPSAIPTVVGGFQRHDTAVSPSSSVATEPSLVVDAAVGANGVPVPWVAYVRNPIGTNLHQAFVRSFNAATNQWVTRGAATNNGILNRDNLAEAEHPSLALAGPVISGQGTQPFVTWYEPVVNLGNRKNIFASKLVNDGGEKWQPVGATGPGRSIPSLNFNVTEDAENPSMGGGSTQAGAANFNPWVAWQENSSAAQASQIFVSRGEADAGANGGLRFVLTGKLIGGAGPSLNVDTARDGVEPDFTFGGPDFTVPWVVWYEEGGGRAARVFASKAVADGTAEGGFRWDVQPACGGNERTCALNRNTDRDAEDPKIAFGSLPGQDPTKPTPWVTWEEFDGLSTKVFVSKFDGTRWVPVGGALNVFSFNNAHDPDLVFVGNVPHVAFIETIGGADVLIVKHLGDARAGRERWDLDSDPFRGLNTFFLNTSDVPSLAASPTTPYVAWQEDARFGNTTDVFEARRLPEGPAWGSNRPPFIRVISGSLNMNAQKQLPLGSADAITDVIGMTAITSSCDHVNGWNGLAEVQVILSDEMGTYFRGRYVAAEDKVYLEDPDNPGTWLGGTLIGTGNPIETRYTTLYVDRMTKTSHGPESAALDIEWVIGFKRPLLGKTLVQSLNLVENTDNGPQESGPFQVGSLNVAVERLSLPLISKNPAP